MDDIHTPIKRRSIMIALSVVLSLGVAGLLYTVVTENAVETQRLTPVDEQKLQQGIERLAKSDEKIVKVDQSNEYEWYLTEMDQGRGYEHIKGLISGKGWTFVEQEGAGYFFEKDGEQLIVTTEMWTRKYVLVKVPLQVNK